MTRRPPARSLAVAAAALLLAASPSFAQDTAPEPQRNLPAARLAWAQQVRALRAEERVELGALAKRTRETQNTTAHAQAQRDLESAKQGWRRRVLSAHLAHVRAAGQSETALRIEQRIAELDAVAQRRAPAGGER